MNGEFSNIQLLFMGCEHKIYIYIYIFGERETDRGKDEREMEEKRDKQNLLYYLIV